jgi:stage IV sporulation protein FB
MRNHKFRIHPLFFVVWIFFLFLDRSSYVLYLFISAMIHESAHIAAYLTYGAQMEYICLMPFGISAKLQSLTAISCKKEIYSSLAGICANLITAGVCAMIYQKIPLDGLDFFILCNLSLATINAIPILPLDGGRALYYFLLQKTDPIRAKKICLCLAIILLITLFGLAIFILIKTGYNFSLLMIDCYLLLYLIIKKTD